MKRVTSYIAYLQIFLTADPRRTARSSEKDGGEFSG